MRKLFSVPGGSGDSVNVQIRSAAAAPSCLLMTSSCDQSDGYAYSKRADGSTDFSHVTLCGKSCELVKSDPSAVVDIILGCPVLQ